MVAPTAAPAPSPPNLAWAFLLEHLATVDAILAAGYGLDVARQYVWEARVLAAGLSNTAAPRLLAGGQCRVYARASSQASSCR